MPRALVAGLLVAVLSAPPAVSGTADELSLSAVRFYRADHHHTRVTAFVEIPLALVHSDRPPDGPVCYEVTFRLADANGATLDSQTWRSRLGGGRQPTRGHLVETMEFLIPAGWFHLTVAVRDSATGWQGHAELNLEGYAAAPLVSDLLLSPDIRTASANDSVPHPGEFRRGRSLVTAAATLHLSGPRAAAHYLLEAYGPEGQAAGATMAVRVRDAKGAVVRRLPSMPVEVLPGGSVLRGKVDLAGLPPGRYELTVIVVLGGATAERSAVFMMDASEPGASSLRN